MRDASAVRPRNAAVTRSAILEAARKRFLQGAYEQVGLRAIAADVGVDPALVSRYFGSKERLFAEVLESTTEDPMTVLGGDRASFGTRVAHAMLVPTRRSSARMAFIQLATRSSASPTASKLVRTHIERRFIRPFTVWLGGERAPEAAWLTASILMGVAVMAGIERRPADDKSAAAEQLASLLQSIVDNV